MTRGQIAQLQELSKCWGVPYGMADWVQWMLLGSSVGARMGAWDKAALRRLWHAYRHQIAAMRKNREKHERRA